MEKLRRGKACRDPNSSLTVLRLSGTQTGSLHRPWRLFPRLVFLIKPSEAGFFLINTWNSGNKDPYELHFSRFSGFSPVRFRNARQPK
ncbi:MAG TPA: hypothetical protein ENN63_10200 [Bacteroidetes bacterium]|nr:hypothetical protein [Bacteroidota bacterium]